jgi:hypothetical protein
MADILTSRQPPINMADILTSRQPPVNMADILKSRQRPINMADILKSSQLPVSMANILLVHLISARNSAGTHVSNLHLNPPSIPKATMRYLCHVLHHLTIVTSLPTNETQCVVTTCSLDVKMSSISKFITELAIHHHLFEMDSNILTTLLSTSTAVQTTFPLPFNTNHLVTTFYPLKI